MDNKGDSAIMLSSNQVGVLQGRQVAILAKIEALTQTVSSDISINRSTVAFLKQEYNEIVGKLEELDRSSRADPLEALPAEIWPNIFEELLPYFKDPVKELLALTLVSQAWLVALTSLAELWTKIWLDLSEADYLAKALVAIRLSKTREIELFFGVMTLDEWRKISSMITPESGRIRYLSFTGIDIATPGESEILRDLKDLPVLRDLLFYPRRAIVENPPGHLRDLELERMPSLKSVKGISFGQGSRWNRFIFDHWLEVHTIQVHVIESLTPLSNLKFLIVEEFGEYEAEKEHHLNHSFSPIESVERLTYIGQNFLRSLRWIGDSLKTLAFTLQRHTDIGVVLLAISRFRLLQDLTISNKRPFATSTLNNASDVAAFELSVTRILLIECGKGEDIRADWDDVFRALMACSSRLETLLISSINITESVWAYITTRRQLTSLEIMYCRFNQLTSPASLGTTTIRIHWQCGDDDTSNFFALFHNHAVRTLELRSSFLPPTEAPQNDRDTRDPQPKRYGLWQGFPNVTSLIITGIESAFWGLRAFPMLKELEIQHYRGGGHPNDWGSNVIDTILIRPVDAPALEKITIKGIFCEWDILILMLERRNFLAERGVTPIKTIVLDREIPYKLLYPVSELLGGKFVERDSNALFSIEAIGHRVLNKSRTGCSRCCYLFKECGAQTTPSPGYTYRPITRDQPLPPEHMIADPPLPFEVEQWFSGKRARREAFLRVYNQAQETFRRQPLCIESMGQREDFNINKYSLAGVICDQKDTFASDEAY